ncbi:MAG: hypothetical protein CL573_03235 [Alphaproteobacteria bacterium]|nr:hypothetical protein [Alphaproteobacteria bacterium]
MQTGFDFFIAIIAICIILFLGWKARESWQGFKFGISRKRGARGERDAVKLLRAEGYEILSTQVPFEGTIHVDSDPLEFSTRVDFLVEKDGIKLLAEVKTGASASPANRLTRRQLREYAELSYSKKVLLVDATAGKVMEIDFSISKEI